MRTIAVINGPNLNLLGRREPSIYGSTTLEEIHKMLQKRAERLQIELYFMQSNAENALIDFIHGAGDIADGLIVNLGGYTHTSVVLRDAIAAVGLPTIEVHLSNIAAREDFRRRSLTAEVCWGTICGLGAVGYELALEALARRLDE